MRCFLNALGSAHPRAARRTLPVMGIVSHWRGSCSFWPWPSFLRVLLLPALPALQDDLANVGMDLCFETQVQGVVAVCEDFLRRQVAGLCRPGDIRYDATSRTTCRKGASWR